MIAWQCAAFIYLSVGILNGMALAEESEHLPRVGAFRMTIAVLCFAILYGPYLVFMALRGIIHE